MPFQLLICLMLQPHIQINTKKKLQKWPGKDSNTNTEREEQLKLPYDKIELHKLLSNSLSFKLKASDAAGRTAVATERDITRGSRAMGSTAVYNNRKFGRHKIFLIQIYLLHKWTFPRSAVIITGMENY